MDIVKEAERWVKSIAFNADHLIRTKYWLKKLNPKADSASLIAALTHDIERVFEKGRKPPSPELKGADWEDEEYNLWHGKRSAKFVLGWLKKKGVNDKEFLRKLKRLIVYHEIGGDKEINLIRDADSISFLEIAAPYFISLTPKKLTKEETREKLNYMSGRISNKKAKSLARPFYEKAIRDLELA
jgi:hypothetical protein